MEQINFIPLANLMLGFLPVIVLIAIMRLWGLSISNSIYANFQNVDPITSYWIRSYIYL
jgi:hypothetical protein